MRSILFLGIGALCAALLPSCQDDTQLCKSGVCAPETIVVRKMTFVTEEVSGVSDGFDLDGTPTATGDPSGCSKPDYLSPGGAPGIDNQFAHMWPLLKEQTGDAIPGLIRGAINDGTLLIMARFDGLDSRKDDDCVDVSIFVGAGKPELGTDGLISSGQTFDMAPESPVSRARCAKVQGGVLTTDPFEAELPLRILDVVSTQKLHGARLRAVFREDGGVDMTLGGGVEVAKVAQLAGGEEKIAAFVNLLVRNNADLAPDEEGVCQQISVTLGFEATPAFLFK